MNHNVFIWWLLRSGFFEFTDEIEQILLQHHVHKPEGFTESSKREDQNALRILCAKKLVCAWSFERIRINGKRASIL